MEDRFERFSVGMSEISRYWHKLTGDEMEKYGLKGTHSIYLLTMYRFPEGLTAPRLCELCVKDKADVSRMMSLMEKKGLVRKESVGKTLYGGLQADRGRTGGRQTCERAGQDRCGDCRKGSDRGKQTDLV